jgi:hypothetical protein
VVQFGGLSDSMSIDRIATPARFRPVLGAIDLEANSLAMATQHHSKKLAPRKTLSSG